MTEDRITPAPRSRRGEKLEQRLRRRLRRLLGEIMPAVEGKALHVNRPFTPSRERAIGLGRDAAGDAPNREQRTGDFLTRRAGFLVVGEIGGAAGAVILAGRVDAHRIVEEGVVMRKRARIEGRETLALGSGRGARIEVV